MSSKNAFKTILILFLIALLAGSAAGEAYISNEGPIIEKDKPAENILPQPTKQLQGLLPQPSFEFPTEENIIDKTTEYPELEVQEIIKEASTISPSGEIILHARAGKSGITYSKALASDENTITPTGFAANIKTCSNEPTGATCEDWKNSCNEIESIGSYQTFWVYQENHFIAHYTSPTYDYYIRMDATDPLGNDTCWGAGCDDYVQFNHTNTVSPVPLYVCTKNGLGFYNEPGLWTMDFILHDYINGTEDIYYKDIYVDMSTGAVIFSDTAWTTKELYECNELLITTHRFVNGTQSVYYDINFQVFDPDGYLIQNSQRTNRYLEAGQAVEWVTTASTQTSGWTRPGFYGMRAKIIARFPDGDQTEYTYAHPYVPISPCSIGTIQGIDGTPSQTSYACGEDISTQEHRFQNTKGMYYNYTFYYQLIDPNQNIIYSNSVSNQTLPPGYIVEWGLGPFSPPSGTWPTSGYYEMRTWVDGTFSDSTQATAYSYANPYVPNAPCPNCSLTSSDGQPQKPSFKAYENIVTEQHYFENTGNQVFNYTFNNELKDPNNNIVSSGSSPGHALQPGQYVEWDIIEPPPIAWQKIGTYTMKTGIEGTCDNGDPRTLYSYAYPYVESTCHAIAGTATIDQDGSCTNPLITKHNFWNGGNLTLPYNIQFKLYDPDSILIGEGENSYSVDVDYGDTWTVTWNVPSEGWKPGVYRAEAEISGTCSGGGTANASNYTEPSIPSSCQPGTCAGIIYTNAKDSLGNGLQNAKVYRDNTYYGTTNASGDITINTSDPSCGESHSIKIECAEGTYCGTKTTTINFPDDDDYLNFTCGMCQITAPQLNTTITANNTYYQGDPISLEINVKGETQNPIDGASLSIYDPFTNTTETATTSTGGTYTHNTTATKTGTQQFNVTATKAGYQNGSKQKNVSVTQFNGSITVYVKNLKNYPITGARIYLDGIFKDFTGADGKKKIAANKGNRSIIIYCQNYSFCNEKEIYVDDVESLHFSCDCEDTDNDYYDDAGEELAGSDPYDPNSTPFTVLDKDAYVGFFERDKEEVLQSLLDYYEAQSFPSDMNRIDEQSIGTGLWPYTRGWWSGFIGGLKGTIESFYNAAIYLYINWNQPKKMANDVGDAIASLTMLATDPQVQHQVWDNYWRGCLEEADEVWNADQIYQLYFSTEERKAKFRNDYCIGMTGGLITEFVAEIYVGGKGIVEAKNALKSGALGPKVASGVTKLERMAQVLKNSTRGIFLENKIAVKIKYLVGVGDDVFYVEFTLNDGSKVISKITTVEFDDLVKAGAKTTKDFGGKAAEEALEAGAKSAAKSGGLENFRIVYSNLDGTPIKVSENYILTGSSQNFKSLQIYENIGTIANPQKGGNVVAEIDRLGLIDNIKPVVYEAKSGSAVGFFDDLRFDDWIDAKGKLRKGVKNRALNPIEELFGEKPDYYVGVPKGQSPYHIIQEVEFKSGGSLIEFNKGTEYFKIIGDNMETIYRLLYGRG